MMFAFSKRQIYYAIVGLLVAVALYFLLYQSSASDVEKKVINTNGPDAFINDVVYTELSPNGQTKTLFTSTKVTHYPNDTSDMANPSMVVYDAKDMSAPPWKITSRYGQMRDKNKVVYLWDHVKLHRDAGKNNQATTFTTSALTYYPKRHYAETDRPVTIVQSGGSKLTAIGMHANLQTGSVKFLSQARGMYMPDQLPGLDGGDQDAHKST